MKCVVKGCEATIDKPGHTLCYKHWKAQQKGQVRPCEKCGVYFENIESRCASCDDFAPVMLVPEAGAKAPRDAMSSTKLGKHFGIPSQRVNLILAELGWIEKFVKGWVATAQGRKHGAVQLEMRENGVPYVVWPAEIVNNRSLLATISESIGATKEPEPVTRQQEPAQTTTQEFRERFPAKYRTTDGHMVRSRGEVLIDNWLYMQGIVHAYERRLPIEEDVLCDFYLPRGNVYIEYWGLEKDPKYLERMQKKKAIYDKHAFNLVNITDEEVMSLDDALPRLLLRFNIDCV
jgi:hypothetical protein